MDWIHTRFNGKTGKIEMYGKISGVFVEVEVRDNSGEQEAIVTRCGDLECIPENLKASFKEALQPIRVVFVES